jgi:ABC-2 type transport system permease protein
MIAAVRSEMLKLRTARLPWGLLALTVALTSIERILFDSNAGGTGHTSIPSLATYAGQSQSINIPGELLLLATIVGIIMASGEFRHSTATNTYLAMPNRLTVMAAKGVAAAAVGLLFGLCSSAAATVIGLSFTSAGGQQLLLNNVTISRYAIGAMLGSALLSVAGVAVGTLIRSQVGGIVAIFVWGFIIEQTIGAVYNTAQRYLPYTAAAAMAGAKLGSEKTPLPFAAAALLLVGVVLVVAAVASKTTLDADVT